MNREEYRSCISPYITGSKPKEQRRLDFCVGAKICSGKTKDREEAERLCKEAAKIPKPSRATGSRKRSPKTCEREVREIANCMVKNIDMNLASNINSVEMAITNSMMECRCPGQ